MHRESQADYTLNFFNNKGLWCCPPLAPNNLPPYMTTTTLFKIYILVLTITVLKTFEVLLIKSSILIAKTTFLVYTTRLIN